MLLEATTTRKPRRLGLDAAQASTREACLLRLLEGRSLPREAGRLRGNALSKTWLKLARIPLKACLHRVLEAWLASAPLLSHFVKLKGRRTWRMEGKRWRTRQKRETRQSTRGNSSPHYK